MCKHIMVFNKEIRIRNRISFKYRNILFMNCITTNIRISVTFTKRTIIKECRKINKSIFSYTSNVIKKILSLFTFIINIIVFKIFKKLFWIRHCFLWIKLFHWSTLLLSMLLHFSPTFFKLLFKSLLSHYTNLFFKFNVFL